MTHGSQQYFAERARFETRLSAITISVALGLLALLLISEHTALRQLMSDPEHFGFEGPERYVRRIELETLGESRGSADVPRGLEYLPRADRGGGRGAGRARMNERAPRVGEGPSGPGDAPQNLLARAMRRSSNLPIIQSENLIFERLVRPHYPPEAQSRGIEGRFSILALIDTAGRVVEVQVQSGDPEGILEREAVAAVRQCRIRPYRVAGVPREIVARFPFNFYLRD
ncbi:MAG: energy transducer TonB [Candidatus Eisenbacteria bacterium]|nr:energy transducer TonB [Candidatus Eisenbacteria bacterium]